MTPDKALEYAGLSRIDGPLVAVEGIDGVAYGELAEIRDPSGRVRFGQVLDVSREAAVLQVLDETRGLAGDGARVRFLGRPLQMTVSGEAIGRIFDGLGRPLDGGPKPVGGLRRSVDGEPINPCSRAYPREFIQTGISAIDGMNALVRGQKLPIFSGSGLPHDALAAQIARQATLPGGEGGFTIVFAAMGVTYDVAEYFRRSFEQSGALARAALFLSLAGAPSVERLLTPRCALTLAEHLAFDLGLHVLVIMTDMTNYCEALREVASARGDIPARKGYPGYLYSNLASLYERAGRVDGSPGSITQVPILTMPADDISHPVPDLTGYITEGQIVLDRDLNAQGVFPPIAVLPSLSRLMKDGIGAGDTRADHPHLASQLFAAYAHVKAVRSLAGVIGDEELSPLDKQYMAFGSAFERRFLKQEATENRPITQTLDLGWQALSVLPRAELLRVTREELDAHYVAQESEDTGDRI